MPTPGWNEIRAERKRKMIARLILAVVIAVTVGILCIILGGILVTLAAPIAVTIGTDLEKFGWILGVLAGLWFFFSGGFTFPTMGPPPTAPK